MINSVSPTSPFSELSSSDRQAKAADVVEIKPAATPAPAAPPSEETSRDFRLVIDFDEHRSIYVYRLIDRDTGRVVTSIPRVDVAELGASPSYQAGGVISTKA